MKASIFPFLVIAVFTVLSNLNAGQCAVPQLEEPVSALP